MAIDPGIYSQIQQPQPFNPLAEMAQFEQLRGAQQQNQLASLAYGDRQRSIAEAEAQRQAVRGFGADTTANYNRLLGTGNLGAAQSYQKGLAEQQKAAADMRKTGVETEKGAFDNYKAILQTIQDPQQAEQFVTASYNDSTVGPLLQKMGPLEQGIQRLRQASATPQGFAQWKANAAIGIEKLAEMAKVQNVNLGGTMQTQSVQPATGQVTQLASAPITQDANSIASNQRMAADAAAGRSVTMRGQNMTDARSREANATTANQGRVPSGYRQNPDGSQSFIPGGPADPANKGDKAMTEGQSKALLFGSRMQESSAILKRLASGGTDRPGRIKSAAESIPLIGGAVGDVVNALPSSMGGPSDAQQQVEQAQRDFVNAVLRRESGASISPSEFENAKKQYFPQFGDSDALISQKQRNQEIATRGMLAELPDNHAGKVAEVRGAASPDRPTRPPRASGVRQSDTDPLGLR